MVSAADEPSSSPSSAIASFRKNEETFSSVSTSLRRSRFHRLYSSRMCVSLTGAGARHALTWVSSQRDVSVCARRNAPNGTLAKVIGVICRLSARRRDVQVTCAWWDATPSELAHHVNRLSRFGLIAFPGCALTPVHGSSMVALVGWTVLPKYPPKRLAPRRQMCHGARRARLGHTALSGLSPYKSVALLLVRSSFDCGRGTKMASDEREHVEARAAADRPAVRQWARWRRVRQLGGASGGPFPRAVSGPRGSRQRFRKLVERGPFPAPERAQGIRRRAAGDHYSATQGWGLGVARAACKSSLGTRLPLILRRRGRRGLKMRGRRRFGSGPRILTGRPGPTGSWALNASRNGWLRTSGTSVSIPDFRRIANGLRDGALTQALSEAYRRSKRPGGIRNRSAFFRRFVWDRSPWAGLAHLGNGDGCGRRLRPVRRR